MANPPTDLMTPPSDLVDSGGPPSDLMSPPSDLIKEEPSSKYSIKDILKRATALPEAVIKGVGKVTKQDISLEPTTPVKRTTRESIGEFGAATGAGAAAGYALPKALQMVPYAPIRAAGQAMELIPPSQRIIGGATGGGLTDIAQQVSEAYGAPTAVKLPLQLLSASIGDVVGQKLTQSAISLSKAMYYGAKGNIPLATSYLGGAIGQPVEQRTAQAAARQAQVFGKPTGIVEGETTTQYQDATQKALKEQFGYGKETQVLAPSIGKVVMVPGTDMRVPAKEVTPSRLEPTGEKIVKELPKDAAGKEVPVSEALRNEFYNKTNETVARMPMEERFSNSPEFQEFTRRLRPLVEIGPGAQGISEADLRSLLRPLRTDVAGSKQTQAQYAQTVDSVIRKWQGAEKEGAKAIDENTARNIRTDLRNAFAQWSERNNLGSPEKAYREAFRAEKIAQAKDEIPYVISQYGERADARKLASQISKDPELKPILGAAIRQKLANTPVEKLKTEFESMANILAKKDIGLSTPREMADYRKLVDEIEAIRKKGGNATPLLGRLRNQLIRSATLSVGAETSKAITQFMENR
jgi:hypothetical protein